MMWIRDNTCEISTIVSEIQYLVFIIDIKTERNGLENVENQVFLFKNNFLRTDRRIYIVSRQTEQTVLRRETEKLVNMFKVREEKNQEMWIKKARQNIQFF